MKYLIINTMHFKAVFSICWGRILRKSYKRKLIFFTYIYILNLWYISEVASKSAVSFLEGPSQNTVHLLLGIVIFRNSASSLAKCHIRFLICEWDEKNESDNLEHIKEHYNSNFLQKYNDMWLVISCFIL